MGRQQVQGDQIDDGTVQKRDLDIATVGESVITNVTVGEGLEIVSSTGADEGTGEVQLKTAGGFGNDYYAFQTTPEQLTTANGWVQAALYLTPVIKAGKYIVHYKAQLTNSSKKPVGFQVNASEGAGPFVTLEESIKSPATANVYETRSAFEEITLSADDIINIQVNFGQTTAGGTGKIRLIAVYLFKVGEL
jgi:hypothetical protein